MSDNKETKQAPAVEAEARDERAEAFAAIHDFLGIAQKKIHPQPDKPNSDWAKLRAAVDALAYLAWRDGASEAAAGEPVLPQGFSAKRVEGHGWVIDPPSGTRWVAYEGTPAGELMQALAAPQPASEQAERVPPYDGLLEEFVDEVARLCDDAPGSRNAVYSALQHCNANIVPAEQPASEQQAARGPNDEQRESIEYAAAWLARSEDLHNQKHAERLRAILAAKGDGHAD